MSASTFMKRQRRMNPGCLAAGTSFRPWCAWLLLSLFVNSPALAADDSQFRKDIQPILTEFCYDCHGDGAKKGNVAFDELNTNALTHDPTFWLKVLKNVRAGLMPPEKKPKPSADDRAKLEQWIKYSAFGLDP